MSNGAFAVTSATSSPFVAAANISVGTASGSGSRESTPPGATGLAPVAPPPQVSKAPLFIYYSPAGATQDFNRPKYMVSDKPEHVKIIDSKESKIYLFDRRSQELKLKGIGESDQAFVKAGEQEVQKYGQLYAFVMDQAKSHPQNVKIAQGK